MKQLGEIRLLTKNSTNLFRKCKRNVNKLKRSSACYNEKKEQRICMSCFQLKTKAKYLKAKLINYQFHSENYSDKINVVIRPIFSVNCTTVYLLQSLSEMNKYDFLQKTK